MNSFNYPRKSFILIVISIVLLNGNIFGQSCDTISNWDGISQDWDLYGESSEVVNNPQPDVINNSAYCLKVVTIDSEWDNISYDMPVEANFDNFHHYRLKVLAPASGGDVTLKFQNSNNSFAHEIVKTPIPGEWTELEFDFSGLYYSGLTTMVIFFDFRGTEPGISWYFDDIIRVHPYPELEESNLPIIIINTEQCIPDAEKISGTMGIIDNGQGMINHVGDAFNGYYGRIGIETRGHSTQMFPKKSYSMETRNSVGEDLKVSLLGMPKESDWILYAPYSDKSMLRNAVSFELGHKMNDIYCSRTVFCELVLNNDYKGVYILMEKIKRDSSRVNISKLKPDELTGDDVTGGYILAVDWRDDDFVYGFDGWKSNPSPPYPGAMNITFQHFYPEPIDLADAQRNYIRSYITRAENALTGDNFSSTDQGYHKYFDVPSFIDLMLLNELSKEVDKYRLSQYFFKDKDSKGGKLFAGPAWDFNLGYGNVDYWAPGIDYKGWIYPDIHTYDYSIMFWWKRLMEDTYFQNLAKTRWHDLRQNVFSDASISTVIDSLLSHIDTAKERNYQRWNILGTYVWPNYNWYNNDFDDEVAYFENFLFKRLHWMDNNLFGTLVRPSVNITGNQNTITVSLVSDYFRNPVLKPEYFKLNNASTGLSIQSVNYLNSRDCLLTLSGPVTGQGEITVTVLEKAINTWADITSHELAVAGLTENNDNSIFVTEFDHKIFIRTNDPDKLPEAAQIININGQVNSSLKLEKNTENVIPYNLPQGFYLLVFKFDDGRIRVEKFVVTN